MRIAFDSRAQSDSRGIGRYVRCLLAALRATSSKSSVITETHRPRGCDIYHSPWLDGAQLRSGCPMVVTLHDLVALKRHSEYLRTGMRFGLRYMAAQHAERIIVPTQAVASDVEQLLGVTSARITVIAEAVDPTFCRREEAEIAKVRSRYGVPERYLLWVGGLQHPEPRKRVAALAATPRTMPLVLTGAAREWARELPDVTVTGQVSDDELAALYSGAQALVFPSDEEGFGLPTIEALACGTPVVACDTAAVREVLGDRATFVARGDMDALILAATAAKRPAPPPPPWTWEDAARATWRVYEDVCEEAPSGAPTKLRDAGLSRPRMRRGPRSRRESS